MMLTPEQLAELREDFAGHNRGLLKSEQQSLFAHIDAQQARIDELEENAGAHALAMKAGKAMLQAETELADKAEAERDHWKANHDNLVLRARLLIEREDLPLPDDARAWFAGMAGVAGAVAIWMREAA